MITLLALSLAAPAPMVKELRDFCGDYVVEYSDSVVKKQVVLAFMRDGRFCAIGLDDAHEGMWYRDGKNNVMVCVDDWSMIIKISERLDGEFLTGKYMGAKYKFLYRLRQTK